MVVSADKTSLKELRQLKRAGVITRYTQIRDVGTGSERIVLNLRKAPRYDASYSRPRVGRPGPMIQIVERTDISRTHGAASNPHPTAEWDPNVRVPALIEELGGPTNVSHLLGVDVGSVQSWNSHRSTPDASQSEVFRALEPVLSPLLQVWTPGVAVDWLLTPKMDLDGGIPLACLQTERAADVVHLANAELSGALG